MKKWWISMAFLALAAAPALATVSIGTMSDSKPEAAAKKALVTQPVKLTTVEAETLSRAIQKERADTENWLKTSPTSYLAAIARRDFGNRPTLTIGSDSTNDVRLSDPAVLGQHLRVSVVGDSFRVDAVAAGARFVTRGDTVSAARLGPGTIGLGRYTIRLSHQHYPALIVFDSQSPRLAEYKGLSWFPVDFHYRFEASLIENPDQDTVLILSTHSQPRRAVLAGWFVLNIGGKRCLLEANRLLEPGVGQRNLSIFFRDETTGKDSYDVGRYVDPELLPTNAYLIDFNNAYSPACAFSPHYNCPIPPKFNKLKVAIKAGEKNSHYMH
jgi:uncharacterized protein (DUF1684 family)